MFDLDLLNDLGNPLTRATVVLLLGLVPGVVAICVAFVLPGGDDRVATLYLRLRSVRLLGAMRAPHLLLLVALLLVIPVGVASTRLTSLWALPLGPATVLSALPCGALLGLLLVQPRRSRRLEIAAAAATITAIVLALAGALLAPASQAVTR